MRYGIIGVGGVGGYYGGKLAHAGNDVHFLFHSDYEHVVANGLRVDSCDGSFVLPHVNAYRQAADMPKCDVVLVALKTVNEQLLKDLLPPVVGTDTLVVLIQNGIGVESDVQAWLPGVQLAAGLAFICSAKAGPGHVNHQCYGSINIGNYSCRDDKRINELINDLHVAGIEATAVEYSEARWKKAVWNMPFNGLTVALNTKTDKLLAEPATEQLVRDMMMEVVEASHALGVENVDEPFVEKMLSMTRVMTPYSPSMKLDYENRRPMEIGYIYSRPLAIARQFGAPMPKLEMLEAQLRFIESQSK
jgi:2-dehydropantoate 2-reductase